MSAQDLIAKLKPYPFATAAIALSLVLAVAWYFRWMGMDEQVSRHQSLDTEWRKMEANVFKNSVNLETHLEKAKAASQDARNRLIQPSELARNYQYFYRLEAATGVRIVALQQQSPPPPSAAASGGREAATAPPPLFSKVGYTLAVSGTFHQLLEFLHAVENGEHFYQLKTFGLQGASEPGSRLLTLTMNFDLLGTP
jgi:hypothetical protein